MDKEVSTFDMIVQFNLLSGQEVNWPAKWPSSETLALKLRLIREELAELEEELSKQESFYDTAKEIADVLFTVHGLATSLGIHSQECLREVSESNMSKYSLDKGLIKDSVDALNNVEGKRYCAMAKTGDYYFVKRVDDGKVLKPLSYFSPDMTSVVVVKEDYNEICRKVALQAMYAVKEANKSNV